MTRAPFTHQFDLEHPPCHNCYFPCNHNCAGATPKCGVMTSSYPKHGVMTSSYPKYDIMTSRSPKCGVMTSPPLDHNVMQSNHIVTSSNTRRSSSKHQLMPPLPQLKHHMMPPISQLSTAHDVTSVYLEPDKTEPGSPIYQEIPSPLYAQLPEAPDRGDELRNDVPKYFTFLSAKVETFS